MKKIALAALAAASLGAIAAPAAAQGYYGHDRYAQADRHDGRWDNDRAANSRWDYRHDWDRGFNINQMQNVLDQRIDRGIRSGRLTHNEGRSMQLQFRDIARLEAKYRRNGLDRFERRDLERRLVAFEQRLDRNLNDGQYASGYRR